MKMLLRKRALALLLTALMLVSALTPLTAFAEETGTPAAEPEEANRGTPVDIGALSADGSHPSQDSDGFIWAKSVGTVSDTWTDYYAASADCVTITKKGTDTAVAIGALTEYGTSDGILLNRGENVFCIRNSQWNLNCAGHSEISPLEPGDVLCVKGEFTSGSGTTVNISRTYITKNDDGTLRFGTSLPSPVFEAGQMKQNPSQPTLNNGAFYFKMDDNEIPFTENDWENAFYACTADCIKLIRDGGEAVSVAVPAAGRGVFVKYSANGYYLNTGNSWFIGESAPLKVGDTLIVEGSFTNGDVTFHVTKSTISVKADGSLRFNGSEEEPPAPDVIEAGVMTAHPNGKTGSGLYFSMQENGVPADSAWSVRYKPVSADVIQRTRNGETVNVANTAAETVLKFSDTGWWLEYWTIGGAPAAGDILKVEGNFTGGNGITFHISRSYIIFEEDDTLTFKTSLSETDAIQAGKLKENPEQPKLSSGSFYFTMDGNEIPFTEGDWSNAFYACSADCIKLIRDGAEPVSVAIPEEGRGVFIKYGASSYYMNTGNAWFIGDSAPLKAGDKLIVSGSFTNGTVTFEVTETEITVKDDGTLVFGKEEQTPEVIEAGLMHRNPEKAPDSDGFYFLMDENDVPADSTWGTRYHPVSADVITRTRGGETVSVGNTAAETILKYSETGWYVAYWAIGGALQPGDVLTVDGNFTGTDGMVFHITRSTVEVNEDGSLTVNGETPPAPQTVIEAGLMHRNPEKAPDSDGFYFLMDENEVPADSTWGTRYHPVSADVITRTRGGETVSVGNTAAETILKYSETGWYIAYWAIGGALQPGDVLTVDGNFAGSDGTLFHITRSTVEVNDDGSLTVNGETPPAPQTVIEAGMMHRNPEKAPEADGFYFLMDKNGVPADSTWHTRYHPVSADVIQRTRGGETVSVGNTAAETIVKYSDTGWYIAYWAIGGALVPGDILTVNGNFAGSDGTLFNIIRSTVEVNEDGSLTVNGEKPPAAAVVGAGPMKEDFRGRTDNGIYFDMPVNAAPYDNGWSLYYRPENAGCIQLTRNGVTADIGNPAADTIAKFSTTEYYLKTEQWIIPAYWPLQEGDILRVGGNFTNIGSNVTMHIAACYIKIKYGQAVFSAEYPADDTPAEVIQAGYMQQDSRPRTTTGVYFTMKENAAPYAADWKLEYMPLSAGCVKLIRNGETHEVALPGHSAFVKFGVTGYYLKTDAWSMGDMMPLQVGDILVVEGQFVHGDTVMEISRSYVSVRTGRTVISTEYPDGAEDKIIEAGVMRGNPDNPGLNVDTGNGTCGLYFMMDDNEIPQNASDPWNNRFYPLDADCIKLIRDGETISIANPDAGEIVKYKADGYYLALDKWAHSAVYPIKDSDILVVEGLFTDGSTVFHITESYISFKYGTAAFSETYPDGSDDFRIVPLANLHSDTRGKVETGVYFDANSNAAPYDRGWRTEYTPVNSSCVKLIRNGQTFNVAIPGRASIVKFSSTEYFVKGDSWAMGSFAPIREGDVLVLEGDFVNGAERTVIRIPRTYIGIWYGKAFVSSSYMSGPAISVVETGELQADEREVTGYGIYFDLEENAAPADRTWKQEYSPASASCIQLIRDGKTTNIAIESHGTIVKFTETEYFLKLDSWAIGQYYPIHDGDILIVGGSFINVGDRSGTMLKLPETYIFFRNGEAVIAKPMGGFDLGLDETVQLDSEEFPEGETVVWRSDNDKRVSVDEDGNVTALTNRGSIRVFVTAGSRTWFWVINMYEETEFGRIYFSSSENNLPIGLWCGDCHEFPNSRLDELEEAGVTVLVGVREELTGNGGIWALLNRARDHGMTVIADIRGWDGKTQFSYAKHPALAGFLVSDEPSEKDLEALAELKASFDELMPDNLSFYVNLGSGAASYEALFGEDAAAELDRISFTAPGLVSGTDGAFALPDTCWSDIAAIARKAQEKELPLEYTMNSIGRGDYAAPDEAMLRWQFAVGLTFGARAVNHYAYASDEAGSVAMLDTETGKTTDLFDFAMNVNREYQSWSDILLSYSWTGISAYDAGTENPLLTAMASAPFGGNLSRADAEQDLLIGSFVNGSGEYAYMVTNAGEAAGSANGLTEFTAAGTEVTLTLKNGSYRCVALIQKGEISYAAVSPDNTVTFALGSDDGVFVIPFMN